MLDVILVFNSGYVFMCKRCYPQEYPKLNYSLY